MLIFMKNAKKFLDLKSDKEKFHALHYVPGRVYASNLFMMTWIDGDFGKQGSYDFVTGAELEEEMPAFDKVIPPVNSSSVYVEFTSEELVKLHAILKGIVAMSVKEPDALSVQLTWEPAILVICVRTPQLLVQYDVSSRMGNHPHNEHERACVNGQSFADLIGYFAQRKTPLQLFAPLRVSRQTPILFGGVGAGAVLSQRRDMTIFKV